MHTMKTVTASTLIAASLLNGCGSPGMIDNQASNTSNPAVALSQESVYGVIESIQTLAVPHAGGAVVGGEIGGLSDNHIAQRSQTPASDTYRVRVRLDNGNYRIVEQKNITDLHAGDRVSIQKNRVFRY